jgi:hypothetical protein
VLYSHPFLRSLQDEALGYLGHESLCEAAQEILAGKLFSHTAEPHPRLVVVDETGCMGGALYACTSQRNLNVLSSLSCTHDKLDKTSQPALKYDHASHMWELSVANMFVPFINHTSSNVFGGIDERSDQSSQPSAQLQV